MCPELADLEQFLTGELSADDRDSVATHLSTCGPCAARLSDVKENLHIASAVRDTLSPSRSTPAPVLPDCIGPFRIIRELGRGGMGVVYEARQPQPDRPVALKVLHAGWCGADRHARLFRREVQVLGRLRHPGVAAIYEAGHTADGRSYFAMELIDGDPLANYVRRVNPGVHDRLTLFAQICDAVAYAHQRGVVHRDLKPSNILVEPTGAPKVLDFGLARLLEQEGDATGRTLLTESGRVAGTVPYMSPEQIRSDEHEIDVRSDVYSLGVILYELLSGRLPYPVHPRNLAQAARAICEEPPARLSPIAPHARGDLETIVLKTLEKDPQQRYATVSALADDVRRYLHDEPILARPPSLSYQLRKLVKRHRLAFAFAATVLLLVVGSGLTAGMLAIRLSKERSAAVVARDNEARARILAEERQAQAQAVSDFLRDMLAAADPTVGPAGPDVTLREVLDEAAARVDRGSFEDHPAVEVSLHYTIGGAYRAIGRFEDSERHLRRAVELGARVFPEGHADRAMALNKLGRLLHEDGRLDEAENVFRDALSMRRRLLGERHAEVATSLNNLGMLLGDRGRLEEAEVLHQEALAMRRAIFGNEHEHVASSLNNLALLYYGRRQYARAEPLFRESLDIDRRRRGGDHPHIALTMSNLALARMGLNRLDEAEELLRGALAMQRRIYGPSHFQITLALNNLAMVRSRKGDLDEAERLYLEALEIDRRLRGPDHPVIARLLTSLALMLKKKGEVERAEQAAREGLNIRESRLSPDHSDTLFSRLLLAELLMDRGLPARAEPLLARAVGGARRTLTAGDQQLGLFLVRHGQCLMELDRAAEAEAALIEGRQILRKALGADHRRAAEATEALARLYERTGRADAAVALRRQGNRRTQGATAEQSPR